MSDPIEAAARAICEADRITHAARSRWERGQARISGRYTHLRWEDLKPDIRDALVEDVRQTAADLSVGEDRITGQRAGWQDIATAPRDGTHILGWVCSRHSVRRGVPMVIRWLDFDWRSGGQTIDRDSVKLWLPIIPTPTP